MKIKHKKTGKIYFFEKKQRTKAINEHDFSFNKRYWGNNFQLFEKLDEHGFLWKIAGWKRGIKKDDIVILGCDVDHYPRYKVEEIKYCHNPGDMFFAIVKYIQKRKNEGKGLKHE